MNKNIRLYVGKTGGLRERLNLTEAELAETAGIDYKYCRKS